MGEEYTRSLTVPVPECVCVCVYVEGGGVTIDMDTSTKGSVLATWSEVSGQEEV